jgi:hypothetical protein
MPLRMRVVKASWIGLQGRKSADVHEDAPSAKRQSARKSLKEKIVSWS